MKSNFYLVILVVFIAGCKKDLFENRGDDAEYIFDTYWKEVDRHYSFFGQNKLNWDSVYSAYRGRIKPGLSKDSLFKLLAQTTNLLQDAHTNIFTHKGIGGNTEYFEKYQVNQIAPGSEPYFEYYYPGRIFDYGKLKNSNIGYIRIKTFEGDKHRFEEIDSVLHLLDQTRALIIDVRSNFGGKISNSKIIASRLADSKRYAGKYRVRNGPAHNDFSDWIDVFVSPDENGFHMNKPVAILTNRHTYSATEWFVLQADVLPNVTLVGDTTGGGSAIPLVRELPNGWLLRVSNSQLMLPSGRDFQNTGLYPDIPVKNTPADAEAGIDRILEKAAVHLLSP
ncbi:S41 family peptidase [Pedobacter sp. SYSU D00535]|uniref:S41 family peptidase n=1 Tax=Pedobacter sp. SYSU D00535 TaxID=2810308 RepID=UPI001A974D45|nr:S41 family peptidase [Pedobacter sp. SYSU D00535]